MIKTYYVGGTNWRAQVELDEDLSHLTESDLKVEIATRGVEAFLGRRKDILIELHEPIELSEEEKQDSIYATLIQLLTDEIVPGCGIGTLLCIMEEPAEGETYGEKHESFVNSKIVLSNVSVPELVKKFDKKYPNFKTT